MSRSGNWINGSNREPARPGVPTRRSTALSSTNRGNGHALIGHRGRTRAGLLLLRRAVLRRRRPCFPARAAVLLCEIEHLQAATAGKLGGVLETVRRNDGVHVFDRRAIQTAKGVLRYELP